VTGSFINRDDVRLSGIGREYVTAIGNRDYSMIMGTTLVYGSLIALANLSVDVLYGLLDPRIKVSVSRGAGRDDE
jgi:oligopeptide transport system permease protein